MEKNYFAIDTDIYENEELKHFGILGMKWGIRRYQNPDGTLTPEGRERYLKNDGNNKTLLTKEGEKAILMRNNYNRTLNSNNGKELTTAGQKLFLNDDGTFTKEATDILFTDDGKLTDVGKQLIISDRTVLTAFGQFTILTNLKNKNVQRYVDYYVDFNKKLNDYREKEIIPNVALGYFDPKSGKYIESKLSEEERRSYIKKYSDFEQKLRN